MPSKGAWDKFRDEIVQALKASPGLAYGDLKKQHEQQNGWTSALCPFKKDTNPSFGFHRETLRFACFHPECGSGSVFDYICTREGIGFKEAVKFLAEKTKLEDRAPKGGDLKGDIKDRPPIKPELADELHASLMKKQKKVDEICELRGYTAETLAELKIGYADRQKRYTIPVYNENGVLVNIRLYSPTAKQKMLNYTVTLDGDRHRYGSPARLFGSEQLKEQPDEVVWLVEGEWDAILLRQYGALAVSGTHGAGTFNKDWLPMFEGREVALCYDADTQGRNAAENIVIPMLRTLWDEKKLKGLKVVDLGLEGNKTDKDITDYFVRRGYDYPSLERRLVEAPEYDFRASEQNRMAEFKRLEEAAKEPPIELDSFVEIDRDDLVGKRVTCDITVNGEISTSYHAVEEFEVVSCILREKGLCDACKDPIRIPHGARDFIGSCLQSDAQIESMLARNYCNRGAHPLIRPTDHRTIQELFCHQRTKRFVITSVDEAAEKRAAARAEKEGKPAPTADKKEKAADFSKERAPGRADATDSSNNDIMERRVYCLTDQMLRSGHYRAEGWILRRPQNQQTTFLIEKMERQEDDYESFRVEKCRKDLDAYCKMDIGNVLADLHDNVTKVWERDELLAGILMTYFSPRWFYFKEELLRGWICMAIIGDVGTGKTKTFEKLSEFMDVGDMVSGTTTTRTGLAYSLTEHANHGWQMKLGRYPANSRKILMVDEVQQLDPDDLKTITTAMASGTMSVNRVRMKDLEAQTRLVFVGNPRSNNQLDNYILGCKALKHTFPQMFLRRLDFALCANLKDIKKIESILFDANKQLVPHNITPEMLRAAIFLMWNIRADQILIDKKTTQVILDQARKLSHKYGHASDIPLVTMYEIDKKVARLGCSYAAMDGSFEYDYQQLVVRPEHIEMVAYLLDRWYSAENCQLDIYSARRYEADEVTNYSEIVKTIDELSDRERHASGGGEYFKRLMHAIWSTAIERDGSPSATGVSRNDICDLTGLSPRYISKQMRVLKGFNLVTSSKGRGGGYTHTAKYSRFMRKLLQDQPEFFNGAIKSQVKSDREEDTPSDGDDGQLHLMEDDNE